MSWNGTAVPNTGTIEKLYINNKLTYEEVVDIVRKANLTPTYGTMYPVAISIPDSTKPNEWLMLCVGFEDSDIAILLIDNATNTNFIYFSTTEEAGFVGWNTNIQNIDPLIGMSNFEANNLVDGISIGTQNEALSSLISITPFGSGDGKVLSGEYDGSSLEITENQTIDISSMLDEQKLPLEINVNTPVPSGTLEVTENGTHNVSEYESVNVNVASSGEDMLQELINDTQSCSGLFYSRTTLTNVSKYFEKIDISNVIYMDSMFYNCSLLETIPQLDTSKVKSMRMIFYGCKALTEVPQLDTSKVTDMYYMFGLCSSLKTIKLDTSSCVEMTYMFYNCSLLETIDISHYNLSSETKSNAFIIGCKALKSLIIRSFGANYVINAGGLTNSGIAKGTGYIYVPSAMVDTLKSATNWSIYADQIRALEDYTVDGTTTGALDETKI